MYICPVCGYDKLEEPPLNHEICPCCSTHFSYNDSGPKEPSFYHKILRDEWINIFEMKFAHEFLLPENYDPIKQLLNIGIKLGENE